MELPVQFDFSSPDLWFSLPPTSKCFSNRHYKNSQNFHHVLRSLHSEQPLGRKRPHVRYLHPVAPLLEWITLDDGPHGCRPLHSFRPLRPSVFTPCPVFCPVRCCDFRRSVRNGSLRCCRSPRRRLLRRVQSLRCRLSLVRCFRRC